MDSFFFIVQIEQLQFLVKQLNKACVRELCHANLARLYKVFSKYHSLKKLHTEHLTGAISSGNFHSVHETAIELIKLFLAESCLATQVLMHNS